MTTFVRLTPADARRVPWKNGRGFTEEIALGPDGASFEAGDFDWRVSRAAVDAAGPFSRFPGIDRVLVVTEGDGLVLRHGAGGPPTTVRPFEPHRFDGDAPTTADLVGGPVRDFNVLSRRGRCRADVRALVVRRDPVSAPLPPGDVLAHVATGRVVLRVSSPGGEARGPWTPGPWTLGPWTLAPGETLWGRGVARPCALEVVPEAAGPASAVVLLVAVAR